MNLKHALTNSPVLALFEPTRETILKTDASTYGLGASLFQIVKSIERPIAFISRALTATFSTICWSLTRLRNLIHGVPLKIFTDHHALCWLLRSTKQELSPKLCRMALILAEFEIEGIFHISGKKLQFPDRLSRFPTTEYSNEDKLHELPILSISTSNFSQLQENDNEIREINRNFK